MIRKPTKQVEDYRAGYPRFSHLISVHDGFFLCRRFSNLRARVLLQKQDRLSILEKQLEQIDQEETCPLYLGMSRCDNNPARTSCLAEIESCLTDYDSFAQKTQQVLSFEHAPQRDIRSLQNWVDGNACISREETEYLEHEEDLMTLASLGDSAMRKIESWVEDMFIRFYRGFRKSPYHTVSTDTNVYVYSGSIIRMTARSLLLLLVSLLLLIPIIICNVVHSSLVRILIVIFSTACYLTVISGLTKSKTMELILAAATYCTVLIVFVSGINNI